MSRTPQLFAVALLAGAAAAQELMVRPVRCGDAFSRAAETLGGTADAQVVAARLKAVLDAFAGVDEPAKNARRMLALHDNGPEQVLLVRDTESNLELVEKAVARMRDEDPAHPTELRIHCTVLRVPDKIADAHGFAAPGPKPLDPAATARLLRAVAAAKGELRNLPEVVTRLMAPFVAELPPRPARDDAAAGSPGERAPGLLPRVHGIAVGLPDDELLLELRLERSSAPATGPDLEPVAPELHQALRMKRGSSVLVTGAKGTDGTTPALWLRVGPGR